MLGLSASASAEMIKVDYLTAGDKLNFVDTNTNVEWLNFDATRGLSYDEVYESSLNGALSDWAIAGYRDVIYTLGEITDISEMVLMGMDGIALRGMKEWISSTISLAATLGELKTSGW